MLPVMATEGLYVPTGNPLFGCIVNVLVSPGDITVVQFEPGDSVQFTTVGKAYKVTLCPPLFVTVMVCAAGWVYPTAGLPKFGAAGETDIEAAAVTVNVG